MLPGCRVADGRRSGRGPHSRIEVQACVDAHLSNCDVGRPSVICSSTSTTSTRRLAYLREWYVKRLPPASRSTAVTHDFSIIGAEAPCRPRYGVSRGMRLAGRSMLQVWSPARHDELLPASERCSPQRTPSVGILRQGAARSTVVSRSTSSAESSTASPDSRMIRRSWSRSTTTSAGPDAPRSRRRSTRSSSRPRHARSDRRRCSSSTGSRESPL